jgi:hypothetical protein
VDEDVMVQLRRFVDDLACQLQASVVRIAAQNVKIDLRH